MELTLLTRRWPRGAPHLFTPVIVNPPYVGRLWRDRGFARAVRAAVATSDATLVQSHERIDCCDIYRAGDGVHAVWLDERLADATASSACACEPVRTTGTCSTQNGGCSRARGCGR